MAPAPDPRPASPDKAGDASGGKVALHGRLRALAAENERLAADLDQLREDSVSERQQRDDFLSYAAHELRTPLTLILGYSQATSRRMRGRPETARDLADLERVIGATRRLGAMIDEMLDVSRLEAGRLRVSARPFSLFAVAQDAIVRSAADRLVELEGDSGLPEALGDEARVGQVLRSLLRNALLVTPPDLPARIALRASHRHVAAAVEDRGPAIPENDLPRLFGLAYVYPDAVDRREGLGLGLFVARGIARALGGDVHYERLAGAGQQGNCFVLSVPRVGGEPPTIGPV